MSGLHEGVRALPSVMLIDDNEDDNYIHARQLLRSGVVARQEDVVVREDGQAALSYLSAQQASGRALPPLVFVDVHMPRMNGFEFVSAYEQCGMTGSLLFMMVSGPVRGLDALQARLAPTVRGIVEKPLDRAQVVRAAALCSGADLRAAVDTPG